MRYLFTILLILYITIPLTNCFAEPRQGKTGIVPSPELSVGGGSTCWLWRLDENSDLEPANCERTPAGLFKLDGNGDIVPVGGEGFDPYFRLDGNNDIEPK